MNISLSMLVKRKEALYINVFAVQMVRLVQLKIICNLSALKSSVRHPVLYTFI